MRLSPYRVAVTSACFALAAAFAGCGQPAGAPPTESAPAAAPAASAASQVERGRLLVLGGACHDCHTPKKIGPNGPEAGVWVIAETSDLPTRFAKIVVTDDRGRYLIPDLPKAKYDVWVRGYGLVDSPKQQSEPGRTLDLAATPAPDPRAAAEYYPAGYWFSLIKVPEAHEFPGTGPSGNGIAANLRVQGQWIDIQKQGCMVCHQLGSPLTRNQDPASGEMDSVIAWWDQRLQMGQRGPEMSRRADRFGREC